MEGAKSNVVNTELTEAGKILETEGNTMTKTAESAIYNGTLYTPDPTKPEETITVSPDKSGDNYVTFENKNADIKPTIKGGTTETNTKAGVLINGTKRNAKQNAIILLKAASEQIKKTGP